MPEQCPKNARRMPEYFRNVEICWSCFESLKTLFSDFVPRTGSLRQIIIVSRIPEKIGPPSPLGGRFEKISHIFFIYFSYIFHIFVIYPNFRFSSLESLKRLFLDFVSRTDLQLQIVIAGRMPEKFLISTDPRRAFFTICALFAPYLRLICSLIS